jgi:hypothetical protein
VTVTTDTAINADTFYVGRQGSNYYDGTLDDVRVFNRPLSLAEVKSLYSWAPGPVAYWNYDEGSGTTLFDRSGYGSNATTDTPFANGVYGGAGDYTSSSFNATANDNNNLDIFLSSFTVMAWVNRTGSSQFDTPMYNLVKRNRGAGGTGFDFMVAAGSGGCDGASASSDRICLYIDEGADDFEMITTSTAVTEDSGWHHIAAVFDRRGEAYSGIYYDGVKMATSNGGTFANIDSISNGEDLAVGSEGGSNNGFIGYVDEAKIYKYARTQQQIIEDMNAGHPTGGSPIASQVAYWKFDEMYGTTANDLGLLATSDLTLTNTPTWTSSGKFSGAIDF